MKKFMSMLAALLLAVALTVCGGCSLTSTFPGPSLATAEAAANKTIELAKQADNAREQWTKLVYDSPLDDNTKQQANNYAVWFNFAAKALGFAAEVVLPLL